MVQRSALEHRACLFLLPQVFKTELPNWELELRRRWMRSLVQCASDPVTGDNWVRPRLPAAHHYKGLPSLPF